MNVRCIDVMALAALTDNELSSVMKEAGIEMVSNDDELSKAINDLAAEERAERMKAAARSIINTIQMANDALLSQVIELRAVRAKEKEIQSRIAKINRAKEYASQTRNYIPLLKLLGMDIPRTPDMITEVPDSFEVKKHTTRKSGK